MPDNTIRPLNLQAIMKLLGDKPLVPAAPVPTAPAMPVDGYRRTGATLVNDRFAGNAELEAIATNRGVLGPHTSPETVALVQQALQDMAFMVPLGTNGTYGGATTQAIKNFQVMAGLKPDGRLGPLTLAALDRFAPPAGMTAWDPGSNPSLVPDPGVGNGRKARVVVSLDQHRAFFYDKAGSLQKIYGVRTGREQIDAEGKVGHATHPGVKVIDSRNADPTDISNQLWPESDGRAFGTRLLGLTDYDPATGRAFRSEFGGQELHGTYQDSSIGRDFSHGCVGMRNQDIEEIFSQVRPGELVRFE